MNYTTRKNKTLAQEKRAYKNLSRSPVLDDVNLMKNLKKMYKNKTKTL